MHVTFTQSALPKSGAVAVLLPQGAKIEGMLAQLDKRTKGAVARAIKSEKFKAKTGQLIELIAPAGTSLSRILICGVGDPSKLAANDMERAGGRLAAKLLSGSEKAATILFDSVAIPEMDESRMAAHLGMGVLLRSYRFDRYRTKKKTENRPSLTRVMVATSNPTKARNDFAPLRGICDGVFFARDLVTEPANVLYPVEFANRTKRLAELGVKVEVLGEKRLEKLGMNALLGVGQGSARETQVVVMEWRGGDPKAKPLAFVGKGVTFDTGGISIKPAAGMQDMKYDMGGAAAVTGLMHALAARKARVNVVGLIGLVENMPSGTAQRPGDVVTSLSGQTIEVINTDAEGRLVLADVLWYAEDRFKPKFIINLATLTGAILVSLGREYAGVFANDDELSEQLRKAGDAVDEKVWRMPMGPNFDKMINSDIADMKNVGGRFGGSITAAQFLKRFIRNVPWAHLDIAGMAWSEKTTAIIPKGATGFGVRLLNRLVADNYEARDKD